MEKGLLPQEAPSPSPGAESPVPGLRAPLPRAEEGVAEGVARRGVARASPGFQGALLCRADLYPGVEWCPCPSHVACSLRTGGLKEMQCARQRLPKFRQRRAIGLGER